MTSTLFMANGETRWENRFCSPRARKSAASDSTRLSSVLRTVAYQSTVVFTDGNDTGSGTGPNRLIDSSLEGSSVRASISFPVSSIRSNLP